MARYYPLDGVGLNPDQPLWGSIQEALDHVEKQPDYADGWSVPATAGRPSPRHLSTDLFGAQRFRANTRNFINQWMPYFADFVLRDLYVPDPSGPWLNITVAACDPLFDGHCQGDGRIPYRREAVAQNVTGATSERKRNLATAWLDLSPVYSTDAARLAELRTGQNGTLRTSRSASGSDLPPFHAGTGQYETGHAVDSLGGLALHTLFVLEHNVLARDLGQHHPDWADDVLFAEARRLNIAQYQKIVFYEFLPKLLSHHLPPYGGRYEPDEDPVADVGAVTALEAFVRTSTAPYLSLVDEWRAPSAPGYYAIDDVAAIVDEARQYGVDRVVRGLLLQPTAAVDAHVVDGLRQSARLGDRVALDIQAARDRGLFSYNALRELMVDDGYDEMAPITSFANLTDDAELAARASDLYAGNISNLDLYVGALMEPVGEDGAFVLPMTFAYLLTEQFERARNADPLYYEAGGVLTAAELARVQERNLCDLVTDHTGVRWMPLSCFALQPPLSYDLYGAIPASKWRSFTPLPGYVMRWTIQDEIWHVELITQLGGWVAVGFGSEMRGADVIQCWLGDDNNAVVQDATVQMEYDYVVMPVVDEELGGQQSILPGATVTRTGGILTARFSRPLRTGDPLDHVITEDETDMIFAHGQAPIIGQHGVDGRAYHDVHLFPPPDTEAYLTESQSLGIQSAASLVGGLQVLALIVIGVKWKSRFVYMSGPGLLACMMIGYLLMNAYAVLSSLPQTSVICSCRAAAALLGMTLGTFPSVTKLWRYHRIFNFSMSRVVRIKNIFLLGVVLATFLAEGAVIISLYSEGEIALAEDVPNQCDLGSTAIGTLSAIALAHVVAAVAANVLALGLLSADGLTIPHVRVDLKAEVLYLVVFVSLQFVFGLVLGLLLFWVSNVTLSLLSAIFAIILSVVPALALLAMKCVAYVTWMDESRQKGKSRMTGSAQVSHVSNASHMGNDVTQPSPHAPQLQAPKPTYPQSVFSMVRKSIQSLGRPVEADHNRQRLQALRDELAADFDRVQRDLNVQTAVATKTRQRLNTVRQHIVMVEEEIDLAGQLSSSSRSDMMMPVKSGVSSAAL